MNRMSRCRTPGVLAAQFSPDDSGQGGTTWSRLVKLWTRSATAERRPVHRLELELPAVECEFEPACHDSDWVLRSVR